MTKAKSLVLAALVALASTGAMAQKAGDVQIGAGWLHLAPQDKSEQLTQTAPAYRVLPGTGSSVSDSDTLGLSATYFVTNNWAVEGVLGIPPKFDLNGEGALAGAGKLGEAKQWSPTLLAKYYFNSGSKLRPFVGAGATYVWYSDVSLTDSMQKVSGKGIPGMYTEAEIDSKFAPVLNAGASYQFDKHWGISGSLSYIQLKTKATLTTNFNGVPVGQSEAKLKLNPLVAYVAATYTF